jgi:polyhydroxyalkanoate synthesis regulator phasin
MNANELADAMEIRASIRRKATSRKSVQEGASDRLADQLEQAATMLRQQQAELTEAGHMIGVLREYISDLENGLDSSIKLNKAQAERNNEPVAYVNSMCNDYIDWKVEPMSIDGQSLYTHPHPDNLGLAESIIKQQQLEIEALRNQLWDLKSEPWGFNRHPVKELTDEEIRHIQAICHLKDVGYDNFIMRFARAILRKAQEK